MRKIQLTLCFIISAVLSFSQTRILMEKSGGVYYIPCEVNGLKLKFIFDTGANDVSISLNEANFMLKNGYMKKSDLIGTEYYQIANGDINKGTTIIIRELKIGDKTLYNVSASIVHSQSAPLLLGQSAIKRFGKFSVDYSTNTLILGEDNEVNKAKNKKTENVEQTKQPETIVEKKEPEYINVCNEKILVKDGLKEVMAIASNYFLKENYQACINSSH
jgi:clan AA aspartic protease (TIGR02281 family)